MYKGAESPPHEHIVMSKIFISYRRDDSAGYAHAVYSQLVQHFSKDQLFMDVDTVEPGVDFVRVIEEAVGESDVLVALIGKRWVGGESGGTSSRLDKEKDYVRLEVSTALARDIRVIPVLVDGMTMPSENILPAPLQPLTRRNAIEISNTRFNFDVERLITAVRKILDEAEAQRKADEENQKRIEEERISAQRKAEQWHTVTDMLRKTEAEGLHEQERQRLEEEARGKADDEKREGIHQEVPNLWRTYGPVAAAVAVVLILFSVFWWPKLRESPKKEEDGQKESIKEAAIVRPQPPPKESGASAPEDKPEAQKEIIKQPPVVKVQPEKQTTAQPLPVIGKVFRDRVKKEGPEMVVIPAGSFRMGDLEGGGDKNELPVRIVRIEKSFAIGRYEVTFEEYDQFAVDTGRQLPPDQGWGRERRPVITVSWRDAVEYAKWLSEQTGKRYRLPTEAEWEYAARGGKETVYWWGNDFVEGMANCNSCGGQWDKRTVPAGSFKPNPFGLYDTAGNVLEWVEDCWHDNYNGAPVEGSAWKEAGSGNCNQRVVRGGSWRGRPVDLRSSSRGRGGTVVRGWNVGIRLAQDLD